MTPKDKVYTISLLDEVYYDGSVSTVCDNVRSKWIECKMEQ